MAKRKPSAAGLAVGHARGPRPDRRSPWGGALIATLITLGVIIVCVALAQLG